MTATPLEPDPLDPDREPGADPDADPAVEPVDPEPPSRERPDLDPIAPGAPH